MLLDLSPAPRVKKDAMFHLKVSTGKEQLKNICAMVKSRYIGDGHPTFNRKSL